MKKTLIISFTLIISALASFSQNNFTFQNPQIYTIADIAVEGVSNLQPKPIIKASGLQAGQKITIPGPDITHAIERLWNQNLFANVQITASKIENDSIYLVLELQELGRVGTLTITGLKKGERTDLTERIGLKKHTQITENRISEAEQLIRNFFYEKGYFNVQIKTTQVPDTTRFNETDITIDVNRGKRVKVQDIEFEGNHELSQHKLQRAMKHTKRKSIFIFKRSKFIPKDFEEDKKSILEKYRKLGYRDVQITHDTVINYDENTKLIRITISEGPRYFFGDITWLGNTVYSTEMLNKLLRIQKGDVYRDDKLQENLFGMEGVSSIYMDHGYLFFNAEPVELSVVNDTVNLEIRIYEGQQATIDMVTVRGNTKTNDHVIFREIRTLPGDLFSRADIIRTQRELAMLGYFDPENMEINPTPNPQDGTVDIEYVLTEKSSDQIEISGGWSGQYIIGSVRLILNNFSARNFFNPSAWRPIPSGDGQSLSLNASINPRYYQYYSISFVQPWFGGKRPNTMSYSVFASIRGNGYARSSSNYGSWTTLGASVGLGKNLTVPDDFFSLFNEVGLKQYTLKNYDGAAYGGLPVDFPKDIVSRSATYATSLSRNSIDQPLYPRRGSMFTARLELTPPFSAFRSDANTADLTPAQRYKWIEYHKWTLKSKIYTSIYQNLVLETRADFGFLGYYNKNFQSPFERFDVGGDGLSNMYYYGIDIVPMRGYASGALTPQGETGANLYNKFSLELRYPLTLKPQATIYVLAFAEAANAWMKFSDYNPFDIKRSAGAGIRLILPMIGLVGFDFGYGFDRVDRKKGVGGWQPSFVLGQQF
ncbi:MAG: outer membrane protein assembly factor BamA [Bacteroidales bacterium]|jgi:outer membrane protein insertion porin family|nr:outer membrane protein assembly factor BamA [Bacteroidales bacterium]